MKQQKQQKQSKSVQKLTHKAGRKVKPADPTTDFDASWSFLEDEQDISHFQQEYELSPEHRFFN
jgi:hypothetical protein